MVVENEEHVGPIWNVVGTIQGTLHEHPIVLGNHRDAWVFGAVGETFVNTSKYTRYSSGRE